MTTSITSTCACGSFSLKVDYPNNTLPIDRGFCLCNSCRRLTGSCGISYILAPSKHPIDITKFELTSYESTDRLTRYFCPTCGCHGLVKVSHNQAWHLATGPLDRTEGIVNWLNCKWVEDTLDGGISVWLKEIVGPDGKKKPIPRYMLQDWNNGALVPDDIPLNVLPEEKKALTDPNKLEAQCHCGGVKFYITRPNEESKKAQSPFPDLMVPYHSHSSENPTNETWWLRDNDTKYLAGTCTCRSCRAASGFEIQPWVSFAFSQLTFYQQCPIVLGYCALNVSQFLGYCAPDQILQWCADFDFFDFLGIYSKMQYLHGRWIAH